ncbi:MAG: tRNA 2-thiouridine(34) synthase TusC [Verrucomicrobiaceae bacterium]|nr:tRNA 2-thiouridine(34) synthase TusC [Verrucomicrobiaceae bacterium]
MTRKHFLVVCRRPPYGESFAREAIDVAMAAAAFDQQVALLFLGDGVLQLINRQDGAAISQKSFEKQLSALPLYDVNTIYIDSDALDKRKLSASDLSLPVTLLNRDEITALLSRSDFALNF